MFVQKKLVQKKLDIKTLTKQKRFQPQHSQPQHSQPKPPQPKMSVVKKTIPKKIIPKKLSQSIRIWTREDFEGLDFQKVIAPHWRHWNKGIHDNSLTVCDFFFDY
jgi:hypothetical protein